MFLINKFSAISRIYALHPYLNEITIRRHLPDEMEIIVTECVAVAVIYSESKYFLTDTKGKLLEEVTAEKGAEYPVVRGVEPVDPKIGENANFRQNEIGRAPCRESVLRSV